MRMGKRPRTGQPRLARMPVRVDLMPPEVLEAIKRLRSKYGLTWMEIEALSARPYNSAWEKVAFGKFGFVDWENLPERVRAAFPERRLPHTNVHRWYDLRVEQAQRDVLARAEQAREIAVAFANASVDGSDKAVMNAARDVIFGMLQSADDRSRLKASAGLIALAEVMQRARANTIDERKVEVDERKLVQLEKDAELKRKRVEQETESVAKKLKKGDITIEDINRLRERTFGLPPIAVKG